MQNLLKFSLFFSFFTCSLFSAAIQYAPITAGGITTFLPYSQVEIHLGSDLVMEDGKIMFLSPTIKNEEHIVSYRWHIGNETLGTLNKLELENLLLRGEHKVTLTIIDDTGLSVSDDIIIRIQAPRDIAKKHLVENIFSIASPFYITNQFTPLSAPKYESAVMFSEDNIMYARIDCSEYLADYIVEDYGIFFTNIIRFINPNLKCLYSEVESKFSNVLEKGIYFLSAVDEEPTIANYSSDYGLFPNFDILSKSKDFNITAFTQELYALKYVDSPLMNNLFKIQQSSDIMHTDTGKYFNFKTFPKIRIENEQLVVDLIDANFTADIVVVDATHIRFSNIIRNDIEDVVYPDNINCTSEMEDMCLNDPYTNDIYGEKIFAEVMNVFLHETIEVGLYTTDYSFIELKGSKLKFIGNISPVIPPETLLMLTIGDINITSAYNSNQAPVILGNNSKELTSVSINKKGTIKLYGMDADLFTLIDNKLSFVTPMSESNPLDANKDGIYELIITAIDNDSQIISYPIKYKLIIPGTVSVKKIEQMAGLWDFYKGSKDYILEYLPSGIVNIHTYDDVNKCYESEQSAIVIKNGSNNGEFEEYNKNTKKTTFNYTAELVNGSLIRSDIGYDISIPRGEQVSVTIDNIMKNQCH